MERKKKKESKLKKGKQGRALNLKKTATSIVKQFSEDPNLSLSNLEPFLIQKKGFTPGEASLLVKTVAGKINKDGFYPITQLELFLTENCNQSCDYCFVEGKNRQHTMDAETGLLAVDFMIAHSRKQKDLSVVFMGGEPLLAFDVLREIVLHGEKRAKKAGKKISFDMTTNGTLFTKKKVEFCQTHGVKYLISIDGDRNTHNLHRKTPKGFGTFDRLLGKIPLLKRYQPWMGARITVHPDTVEKMSENIKFLVGLGFNQIIAGPATGTPWPKKSLKAYRRELFKTYALYKERQGGNDSFRMTFFETKKGEYFGHKDAWGCRAGRGTIVVNSRGEIYPCSKMLGVQNLEGICRLGDLENGITEIGRRARLVGNVPDIRKKCMRCECADFCYGGCYAVNFPATGNMFDPCEDDCNFTKIQHEVILKAFKELPQDGEKNGN